ncbi:FxsB family cyclophane-forming radical SAM/SPASM peptide maturase [Bailinhaonella thermotolerans]|uniref:FxsB family radical SAM/SPASM domain protein n=1 Tax=Bailinhaonella thermotolerans TaxID=1070861 RepID=A0A3A4ANE4_9ACTN|nr:FxsB family cyclophane-forming radical SAM/SPASM peptide maturase [Bailinhaonella thermotolerans]RJL29985.1 FxsB family radical SAM/SPASM domain protein [Bailinhaonella thermotolerans]
MAANTGPIDAKDAQAPSAAEWPLSLDPDAIPGWTPTPFREFVVKTHGRCNLACDYCYMYEMADQSWRGRPARMSDRIADLVAGRIAEHVHAHRLPYADLLLHGGEPLLAGPELIERLVTRTRAAVGPAATVNVHLQTNAIALTPDYLDLFDRLGVRIGVSLDGGAAAHDRHRRHRDGAGSHAEVAAGLRLLTSPPYRHLFGGLLCVADVRNDPVETYEALLAWDPPRLDFLLPHANWAAPPEDGYGDWLIAIFDRWYGSRRREVNVRLFGEILGLLLGARSQTESVGLSPVAVVVVETDGAIEQSDMLKSAFPGAPWTGLHVARDPFDAALRLPGVVARQIGRAALAAECLACPVRDVCGGGLYAHRYRPGSGFANPSAYCRDLFRLISHIRDTLKADLARLGREPSFPPHAASPTTSSPPCPPAPAEPRPSGS